MFKNKIRFLIFSAVVLVLSCEGLLVWAKTWRLGKGQAWKEVSEQGQDKYVLAVAEIKRLVNAGKTEAVRKALDELKRDYPEIAGPDLDAFVEAEILFSEDKFVRAVRSYDKFLSEFPESELYTVVLDREFAIGTAFLAGRKKPVLKVFKLKGYAEGAKIMERIVDRAGDAPIAMKAAVTLAKSYEKREKFNEGYQQWSMISSRWPTGQLGKDALLGMARCKHAAYRGPKYDISNLVSAKSYYENFRLRYREEAKKIDVDKKLAQINEQLAYKQFSVGRYYQRTGSKQSANLYYQMVVDNWPNTKVAKTAKQMMGDMDLQSKKVKK